MKVPTRSRKKKQHKKKIIDTETILVITRSLMGKIDKDSQKVQTSSSD